MMRLLRSAYVIGRRDFSATVLSKAFLFFLLGPVFPLLLGGILGGITANVTSKAEQPVVAIVSSPTEFSRLASAREGLVDAMGESAVVRLVHYAPDRDSRAQQRSLLASRRPPFRAVLTGGLAQPHLTGAVGPEDPISAQMNLILADARAQEPQSMSLALTKTASDRGSEAQDREQTGQIGQMLLFFLTVLLSGMVMSQLIEEKSNKIIEVIAAAMPIDALFIGKLFAMLAASILGIVVWIGAGALLIQMMSHGGLRTLPAPAIGWPGFLALGVVYFAMNYLLLGAVFLTIGAQASTVREVQTLSMPVTFAQVVLLGFAITANASPNSTEAIAAAVFPLSSPLVMLGRAALEPDWWPHLAAIAWQTLWVTLILRVGARMFRKTVLKSGPRGKWWRRTAKASSILEPLS
ncbi:MAG: ABC transporter permease [Sphingomicrobium sp.]